MNTRILKQYELNNRVVFFLFGLIILVGFAINAQQQPAVIITQEVYGEGLVTDNNLNYYIPGKSLIIRIKFNNNTSIAIDSLTLNTLLPLGWIYNGYDEQQGVTNNLVRSPIIGTISDGKTALIFSWKKRNIPPFPFAFEFKITIPLTANGASYILSKSIYNRKFSSNEERFDFQGPIVPEGEGFIEGPIEGEGIVEGILEGEGIQEGVIEGEGVVEGSQEGTVEGIPEGVMEGEGIQEGVVEGEGMVEGSQEGIIEGTPEGIVEGEGIEEGVVEGEGIQEGAIEGMPEGVVEGEGIVEGPIEGEGVIEGPIEGIIEGVPEGITEGSIEGPTEGEGTAEGPSEGEGVVEGSQEGTVEGAPEGVVEGEGTLEGVVEGEGIQEGAIEGMPEGVVEGEGIVEGPIEGEGVIEGPIEGIIEGVPEGITEGSVEGPTEGEGTVEGPSEGEGMVEGSQEGAVEGMPEGVVEGEGIEEGVVEGEGIQEGTVEGTPEGVVEGEGIPEGSIEGEIYLIQGQVINSISKRPVSGAKVELGSEGMTDMILVITDGDGKFSIETGVLQPPYNLTINMRKYISKTIQSVNSGENVSIELDPEDIQKPLKPRVYSTPQSIRIKWDASPEYNIAGYNIYRRTLDENGDTLVDWQRINVPDSETNPTIEPYEGYIQGLEYSDTSIQLGSYYQYAIQSVSDVDRYSVLSDASDIVKGQFLTVFFPEQVNINDASLFWLTPTEDPGQLQIRIPINSKSVYDVSATSVQIDAELPQNLILDPNSIIVEPSGITVGMFIAYGAFAIEDTNIISLRIASADFEAQELYGSGTLFNIVASVSPANEGEICEPLTLLPDDGMGNGVRLYDVTTSTTQPLKVDIENGLLCATNKCILGDADSNGAITPDDAQYILDYWTKSAGDNECIQSSGDINMDGLIDNADSSAIQRWLEGNNIIPPSEEDWFKKSYDHYWEHLKWLADNGSMSAETILATTEKQDTSVNVWLNKGLYGVKGSQKEISVLADNVSNMSGFAMMLNFDGKYAEVNEVVLGDVAQNLSLSYNEGADATGSLRIMAAGKDFLGVKGEVELVRIKFTMKQSGNAYLNLVQVSVNDVYAYVPMFNDPKAPVIVPTQIPKVTVPNVVGMTETEAQATLEQIDLFVSDVIEEVNNEVEPGKVLRQIPVPETEVDAGSTVVLYINKKQQTIEGTPEGTPEGTAEGVVEGTSEGTPEGTPDGTIEGIKEGAGEGTQGGTTEGEQQIKVIVPDVVGKTRDEATIAIKTVGLVVGNVTEEYNNDVGAGKVIRQNPIAGTKVDKGSAVDLVISKGKKRRFIISCGEGKGTIDGSYFADIMMLSVISMFLLGYKKSKRDIY